MSAAIIAQAGAGLLQFIQGLTSSNSNNSGAAAASNSSSSTPVTGGHRHKHGGGGFEKLANAITSALQSVGTGGSATDANQTITDALTKIFKNQSLSPTGETDPTASTTQEIASPDSTDKTNAGLPDSFVQTLKSFGVTPQQFQNDLNSALQSAQKSGGVDLSSIFKSFPIGSAVDAVG